MQVKEIMSKKPRVITPDTSIREAAKIMRECDCGYLPVGENDRLVGAITDRDIVIRSTADGRSPEQTRVRDVMTRKIRYCFEDAEVEKAAELMQQNKIRRLAVLDRNKRLTGILSVGDIATRGRDNGLVGSIESQVCLRKAA